MLLVPVHNKIRWQTLPFVTLFIIVVNTVIYLAFQLDDDKQVDAAITYYQESGLAKVELEAARSYAEKNFDHKLYQLLEHVDEKEPPYWVMGLQTNVVFMKALYDDKVIRISAYGYDDWKAKRDKFDQLYESITYIRYGLRTAEPTATTIITHMFLHGDIWHLLGNMVFLFALGLLVEPALNRATFLVSYLLAGIGSAGLDILIRHSELVPGIGASGAIAGMMGVYAVLYGMKKIRFFYFVGVYFDYAALPAIVLLPMWITNELIQMIINSNSGVNYLAHLGGLCSGALIAFLIKRSTNQFNAEHVEENEKVDKFEQDLEQVRQLIYDFKPDVALVLLRHLRSEHPEHREVLTLSYACSRINPASDEYHALANAILSLPQSDEATDMLVCETFNEYLRMARPKTRMSGQLICRLASRFIRQRSVSEAERLVRIIMANKISCQHTHRLVESFVSLLEHEGRSHDAVVYVSQLQAVAQQT